MILIVILKYLCKSDDDDELMNSEKPPYIENTNWDFSVVYEFVVVLIEL